MGADQDFLLPLSGGRRCGRTRRYAGCRQLTSSASSLGMAVPDAGFDPQVGRPHVWAETGGTALPWTPMLVQFSHEAEFKDPPPSERAFAVSGIRPGNV